MDACGVDSKSNFFFCQSYHQLFPWTKPLKIFRNIMAVKARLRAAIGHHDFALVMRDQNEVVHELAHTTGVPRCL
jgi:hypothetical protein